MEKTAIVTDTNSALLPGNPYGIHLVPMPVILDGECYFENSSITQDAFFTALKNGAEISTSQPSPGTLAECWETLLEEYSDLVYIPMSAGLSGEFQTAAGLAKGYDGRVFVADTRRISVTQRQAALDAARLARLGTPAREIHAFLERDGRNSDIFVAVNTLELLKKSGRVTPAGAALGSILSIKPVLRIQDGKLDAYRKVRGMRTAMQTMLEGLREDCAALGGKMTIRAAYSGDRASGLCWQETLQATFPECPIGLDPLPLSVCCHVGYGALGVGIVKKNFPEEAEA